MSFNSVQDTLPNPAWRTAIVAFILLLLLTVFLYQQTFNYLISIWNQLGDGNYAHGYLVLLISAYMIYDKRSQLKQLVPNAQYAAVIVLVPAILLWLAAAFVNVEVVQSAALLMLITAIVWATFGTQVSRILVFPVLYIVFALPIWFPLSPILQNVTADVVFWLVRLIEIPALREENMIILPSGRLSIAEACSGLRYVLAALTLGTLYAYLNYQTLKSKIIVVLICAGTALLANIIRVFIIIYLAHKTEMQHPLVKEHLTFGWYIFSGLIFLLLLIDFFLHKIFVKIKTSEETKKEKQVSSNKSSSQKVYFIASIAFLLSIGPLLLMLSANQSQSGKISYDLLFTAIGSEGERFVKDSDDWMPLYYGADAYKISYEDNSQTIHLFLGVYTAQSQGAELINDLNRISDGKIWRITEQRETVHNAGDYQVLEQLLEKADGTKRLVWYWYRVAGQDTVNKYVAKALQLKGAIVGNTHASIIALAANLEFDRASTRKTLSRSFAQRHSSINLVIDGER